VIRRTGSIVEAPSLFPRFTGRRNLEILARIDGIGAPEQFLGSIDVVHPPTPSARQPKDMGFRTPGEPGGEGHRSLR
jgi:hypothetical protein